MNVWYKESKKPSKQNGGMLQFGSNKARKGNATQPASEIY